MANSANWTTGPIHLRRAMISEANTAKLGKGVAVDAPEAVP